MRHRPWSRVYCYAVALLKGDLMHEIHDALHALIERVPAQLRALPAPSVPSAPDGSVWSHKQLLGHLIDSAANIHQRFVRTSLADGIQFPAYAQEAWVRASLRSGGMGRSRPALDQL